MQMKDQLNRIINTTYLVLERIDADFEEEVLRSRIVRLEFSGVVLGCAH